MLFAQISDLHVSGAGSPFDQRYQTTRSLERAIAHLTRLSPRPDAVLCTGDLVNEGKAEEYARLFEQLERLAMPWYAIPGNHDDRERLREALRGLGRREIPPSGSLRYRVDVGALRVIALDTLVPGQPGGRLGGEQLDWLDAQLNEAPARPTLLMMHHPPFGTGITGMDAMGLEDGAALAQVVGRHQQIERVLCGHLHRPIVKRFAGTIASTCPSTGVQVELDLDPTADEVHMVREPPACQLHLWREGLGLVTHTSYIAVDAGGFERP